MTGLLLQITIIFSYWTFCVLNLPCNILQWHKWRVAITSSVCIDKTINQWRSWLRACVKAKCHHFEHLL